MDGFVLIAAVTAEALVFIADMLAGQGANPEVSNSGHYYTSKKIQRVNIISEK